MKNLPNLLFTVFLFIIANLQIGCNKTHFNSLEKNDWNQLNEFSDSSKVLVLNFIPGTTNSAKELSFGASAVPKSSKIAFQAGSSKLIAGCGGSFTGSHLQVAGLQFFEYPVDTIDASSVVEGSRINVSLSASIYSSTVPNRFLIYDAGNNVVAASPWLGAANYPGPWGSTLNQLYGTIFFTRSSYATYYLRVQALFLNGNTFDDYSGFVNCVPPTFITGTFGGININYYNSTGLLQFNSQANLDAVINKLDDDYETYNANYENQYSNLTPDELDSVDAITNFDEFFTYRQFETLFTGLVSKRSQVEGIENTWLANNFTAADPDSTDQTYDDAENAVINSDNKLIVGTLTYQFGDGSAPSTNSMVASQSSSICIFCVEPPCFTNRRKHVFKYPDGDNSRKFKLKVAINTWWGRSGAKGKVVSFKQKNNGSWKRSRMKLAVGCGGTIFNGQCSQTFAFSERNPSPSGYKNRKQLKVARHDNGVVWATQPGQLSSFFDAKNLNIPAPTLILQ